MSEVDTYPHMDRTIIVLHDVLLILVGETLQCGGYSGKIWVDRFCSSSCSSLSVARCILLGVLFRGSQEREKGPLFAHDCQGMFGLNERLQMHSPYNVCY
jgi:hypothetical protein